MALANAASPWVCTRRSNVLSLRLGQATTQDGVRGLALRQDQPIELLTSTDLGRTAGEDSISLSSRLCTHTLQHTHGLAQSTDRCVNTQHTHPGGAQSARAHRYQAHQTHVSPTSRAAGRTTADRHIPTTTAAATTALPHCTLTRPAAALGRTAAARLPYRIAVRGGGAATSGGGSSDVGGAGL